MLYTRMRTRYLIYYVLRTYSHKGIQKTKEKRPQLFRPSIEIAVGLKLGDRR